MIGPRAVIDAGWPQCKVCQHDDDVWESVATAVLLYLPQLLSSVLVLLVFWAAGRLAYRVIVRVPRLEQQAPGTHASGGPQRQVVLVAVRGGDGAGHAGH